MWVVHLHDTQIPTRLDCLHATTQLAIFKDIKFINVADLLVDVFMALILTTHHFVKSMNQSILIKSINLISEIVYGIFVDFFHSYRCTHSISIVFKNFQNLAGETERKNREFSGFASC